MLEWFFIVIVPFLALMYAVAVYQIGKAAGMKENWAQMSRLDSLQKETIAAQEKELAALRATVQIVFGSSSDPLQTFYLTRRGSVQIVFGSSSDPLQTFYLTRRGSENSTAIAASGKTKLHALLSAGFTVWTKDEWSEEAASMFAQVKGQIQ